LTDPKHKV